MVSNKSEETNLDLDIFSIADADADVSDLDINIDVDIEKILSSSVVSGPGVSMFDGRFIHVHPKQSGCLVIDKVRDKLELINQAFTKTPPSALAPIKAYFNFPHSDVVLSTTSALINILSLAINANATSMILVACDNYIIVRTDKNLELNSVAAVVHESVQFYWAESMGIVRIGVHNSSFEQSSDVFWGKYPLSSFPFSGCEICIKMFGNTFRSWEAIQSWVNLAWIPMCNAANIRGKVTELNVTWGLLNHGDSNVQGFSVSTIGRVVEQGLYMTWIRLPVCSIGNPLAKWLPVLSDVDHFLPIIFYYREHNFEQEDMNIPLACLLTSKLHHPACVPCIQAHVSVAPKYPRVTVSYKPTESRFVAASLRPLFTSLFDYADKALNNLQEEEEESDPWKNYIFEIGRLEYQFPRELTTTRLLNNIVGDELFLGETFNNMERVSIESSSTATKLLYIFYNSLWSHTCGVVFDLVRNMLERRSMEYWEQLGRFTTGRAWYGEEVEAKDASIVQWDGGNPSLLICSQKNACLSLKIQITYSSASVSQRNQQIMWFVSQAARCWAHIVLPEDETNFMLQIITATQESTVFKKCRVYYQKQQQIMQKIRK